MLMTMFGLEFWSKVMRSVAHTGSTQGFPQLILVSAANPGFHNYFIKCYVPGVLREEEPHGQVRGTKEMVCVPPDHPNQSSKPVVNEEATSVKQRSLAVARLYVLCFRVREE